MEVIPSDYIARSVNQVLLMSVKSLDIYDMQFYFSETAHTCVQLMYRTLILQYTCTTVIIKKVPFRYFTIFLCSAVTVIDQIYNIDEI